MKKIIIIAFILLLAGLWVTLRPGNPPASTGSIITLVASPQSSNGFLKADAQRLFKFPLDFGAHPEFQTEWWYITGNLFTSERRHIGYQLTFFRRGLIPPGSSGPRESAWAVSQVYFAHLALTDTANGTFQFFERFERGAAGMAGARSEPEFQVWLRDWQVAQTAPDQFRLKAKEGDLKLDLLFMDKKGPVLQGDQGYSRKGPQPGNASYYISQTRLESRGIIEIGGSVLDVSGTSWIDHEFSTSALAAGQIGWDWFAFQFDDGVDLMVYRIRNEDGSPDPYAHGLLVFPDGTTRSLAAHQFQLKPVGEWKSPHTGARYPAEWVVEIPADNIILNVKPRLLDQELRVSFRYWEGAVEVNGNWNGKSVTGVGYVEMTGYAESMQGQF